jgi:hypothetical protein
VRGGLDDALDKLARRDELRRRAAGEAIGTPPAVQELVEAIATVVGRNPKLAVTVGVEGAGEPLLLHFAVEDGVVQVNADTTVAARVTEAEPASPRHADFDIDLDDHPTDEHPYAYPEPAVFSQPAYAQPAPAQQAEAQDTSRLSYDDRDRYDPGTGYDAPFADESLFEEHPYGGRRRFGGSAPDLAPQEPDPGPHPFAATPPPPVPPQTAAQTAQTTRRIHAEQHRAPEERSAEERSPGHRGMPTPLPEPIPLKVDSEETELAAKRLSALLRDNPTLLRQSPHD